MIKRLFKYLLIGLVALIVAKWIVMFLPLNKSQQIEKSQENNISSVSQYVLPKKVKEVELNLNFNDLKPRIEEEYELAKQDIYNYINEQINLQKEEAKYRLTKEDGFLDWLFGYWTGWKIMYKKAKGLFGSEDNEIKMVSDKFEKDVINPGLNDMFENINNYAKNRMEDYYKSVISMTIDYINEYISNLQQQGYTDINIDKNSIPWSQYIVARGGDVLVAAEIGGLGIGAMVGKYVGSKVAAIIGPKLLGLIEAKTATIIAGKIASVFEFVLAPVIDFLANEAVKAVKYDETKRNFEEVIDNIFNEIEKETKHNMDANLVKIKNQIYEELNKQVIIKAKESE